MNTMCPACSGILTRGPVCGCGEEMVDSGPVTDYFGPYSPYFSLHFESSSCIHLFSCSACGYDRRIAINLENI